VETYTDHDLQIWTDLVGLMHTSAVDDHDHRTVVHGAAMVSSGAGLVNQLPEPVARLLLEAIEVGYGQALRDVRDGHVEGLGPADAG
jgi:hypothetical protein